MNHKLSILGVNVSTATRSELLLSVSKYLKSQSAKLFTIFTPNPEQVVDAQSDETFREILNSADIAIPDGEGIVWAQNRSTLRLRSGKNFQKIPGVEFMEELCELAAQENYPVAFIGGRGGVAEQALIAIQKKFPGLTGWAEDGPEILFEKWEVRERKLDEEVGTKDKLDKRTKIEKLKNQKFLPQDPTSHFLTLTSNKSLDKYVLQIVEKINNTNVRVVFVGLGAPKQEYFIESVKRQASSVKNDVTLVFMSVGGAFDILSGRIKRAPKLLQNLKLEWLWRLTLEPWRIKRQMKLIKFVYLVLTNRK